MATAHDRKILNRILNPLMPDDETEEVEIAHQEPIDHPNYEKSQKMEGESIRLAEQGKHPEAIEILNQAIELCPINPSAFNNRAQVHRLEGNIEKALSDLEESIRLSEGKGRSACQSFVQRALIRRLKGENELAKEDYERAAALGSSFAKMQLVSMNPYAAMCNKMLSEVMQNLREGKE